MNEPGRVQVRVARPDDPVLSDIDSFRCADPTKDCQVEVEDFIVHDLIPWTFDPRASVDEPRLLVTVDEAAGRLVGLSLHEHAVLEAEGVVVPAERITVVAVSADYQGKRDDAGNRYSDIVLSSALADIEAKAPSRRVFGLVDIENDASFRLLVRHGFTRRVPYRDRTVIMTFE